jgi:hypothetical protein
MKTICLIWWLVKFPSSTCNDFSMSGIPGSQMTVLASTKQEAVLKAAEALHDIDCVLVNAAGPTVAVRKIKTICFKEVKP